MVGIGQAIGIPATNETECERARREGRTWDASFACPAGTFLSYPVGADAPSPPSSSYDELDRLLKRYPAPEPERTTYYDPMGVPIGTVNGEPHEPHHCPHAQPPRARAPLRLHRLAAAQDRRHCPQGALMLPAAPLVAVVGELLGKVLGAVLPDPAQRAAAQAQAFELLANGTFAEKAEQQLALAQIGVNKSEAESPGLYKGGWRPAPGGCALPVSACSSSWRRCSRGPCWWSLARLFLRCRHWTRQPCSRCWPACLVSASCAATTSGRVSHDRDPPLAQSPAGADCPPAVDDQPPAHRSARRAGVACPSTRPARKETGMKKKRKSLPRGRRTASSASASDRHEAANRQAHAPGRRPGDVRRLPRRRHEQRPGRAGRVPGRHRQGGVGR
ncbi:hypothetical protein FSC37_09170 [Piscinibacter aquaticus]|uniref:Uncharacterized protein n=1 Tax=Piscinibacter aquaticus TaxID=392597 RepID=A0A5C6TZZ5_9BURK|nr:hypothetical protein FSC37_09170 [Piscinibacter aquaticus]